MNDQLFEELSKAPAAAPCLSIEIIGVNMDAWIRSQIQQILPGTILPNPIQLTGYGMTYGYMCGVAAGIWSDPGLYYKFSEEERVAIQSAVRIMKAKLQEIKNQKSIFSQVLSIVKENTQQ